jgi:hypothetical protein
VAANALAFWYWFVFPHRSRLAREPAVPFWSAVVAPNLDSYMGRIFESVVREGLPPLQPALGPTGGIQMWAAGKAWIGIASQWSLI